MREEALSGEVKTLPQRRIELLVFLVSLLATITTVFNRNFSSDRQHSAESTVQSTPSHTGDSQNQHHERDNHCAGVPSEEFNHNEYPYVAPEPVRSAETTSQGRQPGSKPRTPRDGESKSASSWMARAAECQKKIDPVMSKEGECLESLCRRRKRMHQTLLQRSLWSLKEAEEILISREEQTQFPQDCSRQPWLAHHDSGIIISDVRMCQPELLLGHIKGWTVVPTAGPKNIAFAGCGGTSHMHLVCCLKIPGRRFEGYHPSLTESLQQLSGAYLGTLSCRWRSQ